MSGVPSGADPRSLTLALQQAQATGNPAPVLDKAGHLLYYVDTQGTPVDKDGAPLGQPKRQVDSSKNPKPAGPPQAPNNAPNAWNGGVMPNGQLAPYGMDNGSPMFYGNVNPEAEARPSGDYSTENGALIGPNQDRQQRLANDPAVQKQTAQQAKDAASLAQAQLGQRAADAAGLSIWVNGTQLAPVLNADGSVKTVNGQIVYSFGGYGSAGKNGAKVSPYTMQQMPAGFDKPSTPNSVWDALNLGATPYGLDGQIHSFDTFLVAGPGIKSGLGTYADDTTGAVLNPQDQHVTYGYNMAQFDQAEHGGKPVETNQTGYSLWTIGEGLQAMQQMASDNPKAFDSMVTLLKRAGYDSSSSMTGGKALEGGPFTIETAMALAHAMKDASMQTAFEMGQNNNNPTTGFVDFLKQKVDARARAAAQAYEPMKRDYTDPADVASAARSAAQQLIGRNLTDQEQAAFEASFHNQQVGQYDAADKAAQAQAVSSAEGQSSPGPTVTMPSPSGQAEQYLQGSQFAGDRGTYLSMQYLDRIFQSLGVK